MFSMIVTIISIALVVVLAIATLYYGGTVWANKQSSINASILNNQASQIYAASLLYANDHNNTWTGNINDLVQGDYLASKPIPPVQALTVAYSDLSPVSSAVAQTVTDWKIVLNSSGKLTHIVLQQAVNYTTCIQVMLKAQNRDNIWSISNNVQIGTQVRDDLIFQCVDSATPAGIALGNPAGYTYYWLAPGIGTACNNLTGVNSTLALPETALVCDPSTIQTGPPTGVTCPGGQYDNGAGICLCNSTNQLPDAGGYCPIGCPVGQTDTGSGTCLCNTNNQPPVAGYCAVSCPTGQQDNGSGTCVCTTTNVVPVAGYCPVSCPANQHDNGASSCVCDTTNAAPVLGFCPTTCPAGQHDDGSGTCLCDGTNQTPVGGLCTTSDGFAHLISHLVSYDGAAGIFDLNIASGNTSAVDYQRTRTTGVVGSAMFISTSSNTSGFVVPKTVSPPTSDYTVEFWWKSGIPLRSGNLVVYGPIFFNVWCSGATCTPSVTSSGGGGSGNAFPINTWTHLALTINATTSKGTLYVNGQSGTPFNHTVGTHSGQLNVPGVGSTPAGAGGFYDELKITRALRYTGNFTPDMTPTYVATPVACPTGQHDQGTGTCICDGTYQSPIFGDCGITPETKVLVTSENVAAPHLDEVTGSASGTANKPLSATGKNGMGMWFANTTEGTFYGPQIYDMLVAGTVGYMDFTAELWYKPTSPYSASNKRIMTLTKASGGDIILEIASCPFSPCKLMKLPGGGAGTIDLNLDTWYHLAISRQGAITRMFVNGNLVDTVDGQFLQHKDSISTLTLGKSPGIYDDVRVIANKALYTANFTPPSGPATILP